MQYPTPKSQKGVLEILATKGKLNTLEISKQTNLTYPVVFRTVAHLTKKHLIWLSETGNRGPKSPKFYELTIYGFIELFLMMDETNYKTKFWKQYEACPRYLTHLDIFHRESLIPEVKVASQKLMSSFEEAKKEMSPYPPSLAFLPVRTSTDSNFFIYFYIALYPLKLDKLNVLKEVFEKDPEFLDSWDTNFLPFISGLHDDILTIDKKIHETLPRYDQTQHNPIFDKHFQIDKLRAH